MKDLIRQILREYTEPKPILIDEIIARVGVKGSINHTWTAENGERIELYPCWTRSIFGERMVISKPI